MNVCFYCGEDCWAHHCYIIITKCKQHCCEALYNAEPMNNNSDDIFLLASI